jgi:Holliday junction resolvase RusA-like endonuclease
MSKTGSTTRSLVSFDESLKGRHSTYIDLPGDPFAKQRPRAARKGRFITIYTPKETKDYESKVAREYIKVYGNKKLSGDLTVDIEGIFSVPKSVSKEKAKAMVNGTYPHTKKPDCDNMAKICLDALNGIAYHDDAQITTLNISKHYGNDAKVKITIKENKSISDLGGADNYGDGKVL